MANIGTPFPKRKVGALTPDKMYLDENSLVRHICKKSYYCFVKEFWNTVVPDPFIDNWHIKYICDELQFLVEWFLKGMDPSCEMKYRSKPYDLIINVSPGSTKSLLSSVFLQPWVWTRYPGASFIGSSFQENLSIDLARKSRMVIKSDKYRKAYLNVRISMDQDAKGKYASTLGGERNSVGNKGGVTGRHADFIVIDDPLDPKGSRSDVEMQLANQFITETLWSRKKDKARTPTILIMQRLHADDPTALLLEMSKRSGVPVRHLCFPAILTEHVKPVECRKFYKDGLFDPVRLSRRVLSEAEAQSEYSWAGQFLQSPVPIGGGLFKTDRITLVEPIDAPKENEWVKKVRYWDKAATKEAGCYTVGFLMGKDRNQRFWILDVVRGRWDTAMREATIKATALLDREMHGDVVIGVEQEGGSGGKDSAVNTVKALQGFRVTLQIPKGKKEYRADPFSSQVNAGNVYMIKAPWNRPLLDEMMLFPKGKYKDQVDAGSGAFSMLTQGMRRVGGW